MKQEKIEQLTEIPYLFFFIVGVVAWILLGCCMAANVQTWLDNAFCGLGDYWRNQLAE